LQSEQSGPSAWRPMPIATRAVRAETDAKAQTTAAKDAWATARRNGYAGEINVGFQALAKTTWGGRAICLTASGPRPVKKICAASGALPLATLPGRRIRNVS
jgi:hypothetical protein